MKQYVLTFTSTAALMIICMSSMKPMTLQSRIALNTVVWLETTGGPEGGR